jgi:hypothetical protein
MKIQTTFAAVLLLGGLAGGMVMVGGCKSSTPAPAAAAPKAMTHVITVDQPCYPNQGAVSCGTLKAGTKVLLLIPGEMAQVETTDGKMLYTKIDGMESLSPAPPPKSKMKPMTMPATKPVAAMPAKMMTHFLAKDQPYYMAMPTAGAKPAGMLKAGTKVLLLIPGSTAQVETADAMTVYTPIDGVELIARK